MSSDSDNTRSAPDVAFRQSGTGMYCVFTCPRCGKPRQMLGRRLQRVQGVKQWICGKCSERVSK